MRCGLCGNENAESNYYCGMCGGALTGKAPRPVQPSAQAPAVPSQATVPVQPPAPRQAAPPPRSEVAGSGRIPADLRPEPSAAPVITGPSFLGLSTPGPARSDFASSRHSPGHDPLQRSSGNLDYLLEDEEEPRRGWGKLILVVVALALAVGFGYLRWRQGGFDWLNNGDKKPAAIAPAPESSPGSSAGTTAPAAPDAATSTTAPQVTTPGQSVSGADSGNPAAAPAGAAAAPAADPATQHANPLQTTSPPAPGQTTTPPVAPPDSNPAANSASPAPPADSDSNVSTPATAATAPAAVKPRQPKPTPVKPLDPVVEAERYIYGRGVHQDCDHGVRLLKPAAEQSNTKAMISLGALYSTGTCTPRDLPTAYRWFALALHKEPDNQPLQNDLQKLWSEMTQPERQLAIKLSQ